MRCAELYMIKENQPPEVEAGKQGRELFLLAGRAAVEVVLLGSIGSYLSIAKCALSIVPSQSFTIPFRALHLSQNSLAAVSVLGHSP